MDYLDMQSMLDLDIAFPLETPPPASPVSSWGDLDPSPPTSPASPCGDFSPRSWDLGISISDFDDPEDDAVLDRVLAGDVSAVSRLSPHQMAHRLDGRPLLHIAVLWRRGDLVEALLERGADASAVDNDDRTALDVACSLVREDPVNIVILRLLLVRRNDREDTALKVGALRCAQARNILGFVTIMDHLGDSAPLSMAVHYASRGGNPELLKCALKMAGKHAFYVHGDGPVHAGCRTGSKSVLEVLLDNGFRADTSTERGELPLGTCVRLGFTGSTALLMSRGYTRVTRDGDVTVLHYAAINGRSEFVSTFGSVARKLRNARDRNGHTATHVAATYGYLEFLRALLDADALVPDSVAERDALEKGHQDVVKFIQFARRAEGASEVTLRY